MKMKRGFRALVGVLAVLVSMNASVFLFNSSNALAKEVADPGNTPSAPTSLSASATSASQINISWTASVVSEFSVAPSSYVIYRTTGSDINFAGLSPLTTVSAGQTTYSDTGLSASTKYNYKVAAKNGGLESSNSNLAYATTQAPAAVAPNPPGTLSVGTVSNNPNQISLSWVAASGPLDYYVVYRGTDSGNLSSYGSGSATSFVDSSVTPGQTYYYKVASYSTNGNLTSSFSNTVNATVPNPTPTPTPVPGNLTATAVSDSQINVSWSWSGASSGRFFVLERSMDGVSGWIAFPSTVNTSYQDTNLAASTRYYYRVRAFVTDYGSYSNTADAKTFDKQGGVTTISVQLVNLTATPDCPSRINLTWTSVTGATQYTIQRSIDTNGNFSVLTQSSGTSYSDSNLEKGKSYYYRVVGNDNQSSTSNIANVYLTCESNPTSVSTGTGEPGGGLSTGTGTTQPGGTSMGTTPGAPGGAGAGYGGGEPGNPGSLSNSYTSPKCGSADSMVAAEWRGSVYQNPYNNNSGIIFNTLPDKSAFSRGERTAFSYCWQNPTNKIRRIRVTRQLYDQNGKPVGGPVSATKTVQPNGTFVVSTSRVLGNYAPGPYQEEVKVSHLYSVYGEIPLTEDNSFWITMGDEGNPGSATGSYGAPSSSNPGVLTGAYGAPGTNPAPGSSYGTTPPPGAMGDSTGGAGSSSPSASYGAGTGPGPGSVAADFSPVPHTDPPGTPGSPGIIYEWLPGMDSFPPGAIVPFGIAFTPAMGESRDLEIIHTLTGPAGFEKNIKLDPPTPGVTDPGNATPPPGGGGPGAGDPSRGIRRSVRMTLPKNLRPGRYTSTTQVRDKKTHQVIDSTSFTFEVYELGSK